jgi:pyridoxine 4-dehydrogenase
VSGPARFLLPGGRTVRRIGLGAMRLSGRDRAHDVALLRRAVALGVDHIDTARMYGDGRNEELIAEALAPFPEGLLVATKGGIERTPAGYRDDGRPETLRRHVHESLRRLRVDRIGLYYLHEPDPGVPIAESVGALARLRDEDGAIGLIGVSNVSAGQLAEALAVAPIAAVQNRYSPTRGGDEEVLDLTSRLGIAFVPWGPVRDAPPPPPGAPAGTTPAQAALRALLDRAPNVLPIPGTSSIAHLEENTAADAGPGRPGAAPGT